LDPDTFPDPVLYSSFRVRLYLKRPPRPKSGITCQSLFGMNGFKVSVETDDESLKKLARSHNEKVGYFDECLELSANLAIAREWSETADSFAVVMLRQHGYWIEYAPILNELKREKYAIEAEALIMERLEMFEKQFEDLQGQIGELVARAKRASGFKLSSSCTSTLFNETSDIMSGIRHALFYRRMELVNDVLLRLDAIGMNWLLHAMAGADTTDFVATFLIMFRLILRRPKFAPFRVGQELALWQKFDEALDQIAQAPGSGKLASALRDTRFVLSFSRFTDA
jgi:hypothetical protein